MTPRDSSAAANQFSNSVNLTQELQSETFCHVVNRLLVTFRVTHLPSVHILELLIFLVGAILPQPLLRPLKVPRPALILYRLRHTRKHHLILTPISPHIVSNRQPGDPRRTSLRRHNRDLSGNIPWRVSRLESLRPNDLPYAKTTRYKRDCNHSLRLPGNI